MRAEIDDEICEGDKVVARVNTHGQGDRALVGPR
jgi:hypothetical protein